MIVPLIIVYMILGYFVLLQPGNLYNALVNEDWKMFSGVITRYAVLTTVILGVRVLRNMLRESLFNQMRRRLARKLHEEYFSVDSAHEIPKYFHLVKAHVVDNPDQRIVGDSRDFAYNLFDILISDSGGVIESTLSIVFYSYVTYSSIGLYGMGAAYAYTGILFALTLVTINVTSPVVYRQEQLEGSLRYEHSKVRRYYEQIVLVRSYLWERANVNRYLMQAVHNQWVVVRKHVMLNSLQQGFSYYISIIMYTSLAVALRTGIVSFDAANEGEKARWISQTGSVFLQLLYAFTMFIEQATKLSKFVAIVERLYQLCAALGAVPPTPTHTNDDHDDHDHAGTVSVPLMADSERGREVSITKSGPALLTPPSPSSPQPAGTGAANAENGPEILLDGVRLRVSGSGSGSDSGEVTKTVGPVSLRVSRGRMVYLSGVSGSGKTSIVRLIRGILDDTHVTSGRIDRPLSLRSVCFVPQSAYLPSDLRSLRDIVTFPLRPDRSPAETQAVLHCLASVRWRGGTDIDARDEWTRVLSTGEQQQLAIAGVLHKRPALAVLDEPTSAMDEEAERAVAHALLDSGVGVLFVGHSPALQRELAAYANVHVVHMP